MKFFIVLMLVIFNNGSPQIWYNVNTNIPFETRHFDHSGELHRWWDFAKSIKLNFEEENNSTVEIFLNRAIKYEEFKPISESAKAYTEKSQEN